MKKEHAIDWIKKSVDKNSRLWKAIESLVPELSESEDERIRKEIISALKFANDGGVYDKHIAYLEKQKAKERLDRMAPIYNDKESFESALEKAWKYYNESASRKVDSFEDDYIECVFSKGFREGFLYREKQKEQKPNFSEKDSTDFEIEVHEIIAQARNDSRLNDADVLKQFEEEAAFALMLKANKLIEQKSGNSIRVKIISRAKSEKQVVLITESDGNAEIAWDTRSLEDSKNLLEYGLAFINGQLEKQKEQKPTRQ